MHTTNYFNTFIQVAEDCDLKKAKIPPVKNNLTVANIQFDLVFNNPYKYDSDDVFFEVYRLKNEIPDSKSDLEREKFFSKGQPCFRASPLTKRYGWGVHSNAEGKVALYALESAEYAKFASDPDTKQKIAMKSKR